MEDFPKEMIHTKKCSLIKIIFKKCVLSSNLSAVSNIVKIRTGIKKN